MSLIETTQTSAIRDHSEPKRLGKLRSLGLDHLSKVALYLPHSWDDFTKPLSCFRSLRNMEGLFVLLHGSIVCRGVTFTKKVPMLKGSLIDSQGGVIQFVIHGDSSDFQEQVQSLSSPVYAFGQVSLFNNTVYLNKIQIVDDFWVGRLRPNYSGIPRVLRPASVLQLMSLHLLDSIPLAAENLCQNLNMESNEILEFANATRAKSIERLIYFAHYPKTKEQGEFCQKSIEYIAAYKSLLAIKDHIDKPTGVVSLPHRNDDWHHWASQLPFALTPCQEKAVREIVSDLMSSTPMKRLLSGDVGYGKTPVFAVASMTVIASGGRVALLLPSQTLAEQAYRELTGYWPLIADKFSLIIESTPKKLDLTTFDYLIGTTALLFRETGKFDLVIVDEQQRLSTDQRNQLVGNQCHLLEATATCIPRTQALIQYGAMSVSILDVPPTPKHIKTTIRYAFEKKLLFAQVNKTILAGYQVLIVYPRKTSDESVDTSSDQSTPILDVDSAAEAWEKFLPGRIRYIHADRSSLENESSLKDMRDNLADILVATTVVEVGVNIPKLRHVIIVDPHRFGLSTLHQIRGRAARTGGRGICDLYVVNMPRSGLERLKILERTQNGFEIAHADLYQRGFGDLSVKGKKQSGSDSTVLFGRTLSIETLDQVIEMEKIYRETKSHTS